MKSILITIYLQPGAKNSCVMGFHNGNIKVKVNAPPIEGKANEALILFLSDFLAIPKSNIAIISGNKSRIKKLSIITSMSESEVKNKLTMK